MLVLATVPTERLLLRPFRSSDLDDLSEIQSDAEVVRFLPWSVRNRAESAGWLEQRIAADRLERDDDGVAYAVERRSDRKMIGSVTLWWRSVEHRQGEVGFVLAASAQRRGYALEATSALLDLAFTALDLHRVYGRADARNDASAALMRRLGMRQEAHLRENEIFKGEWGDEVIYAILREEWAGRRGGPTARG